MKVLELLSDPKRWTQGAMARDSDGMKRATYEKEATCFCLVGAIQKCYGTVPGEADYTPLRNKIVNTPTWQKFNYTTVPQFNDNVSYDDMIQMVREAGI